MLSWRRIRRSTPQPPWPTRTAAASVESVAQHWIAAFSGQMGDVFGDHDDTLRYLDEERRGWEPA